jgi:tRNA-binding EMAP/Myf-like protein
MKGKVVVMTNLKHKKIAGFLSQGMVVCATSEDKTQCSMLVPDGEIG